MKYALLLLATSLPLSTTVMASEDCPILPSSTEQFAQLDTDSDTVLSKEEFASFEVIKPCIEGGQAMETPEAPTTETDSAVIFAMLDTDANGTLDLREFEVLGSKNS